jgi:hypothetical protein
MKKLLIALPLVAALFSASCVKVAQESAFKADGTATTKTTMGYKLDAVEALKGLIAQFTGGGDDESEDGPAAKIDEALKELSEEKLVEQTKGTGVEITKSKTEEKDGWKSVEIEGVIKDVNAWVKKSSEALKDATKDAGPIGGENPFTKLTPHFYKTDKENVAKFVLIPPLGAMLEESGADLSKVDEMDDEQREQIEAFINTIRSTISLDEMRVEMKMKLPGKVLAVKGCKQDGDDGFALSIKGSDLGLDGVKTLFGLKDGVYATFQFEPKDFKIVLEEEKVAESKPAAPKEEKKVEKKDEEEKKKGGEDG